jgi:heterodisulfide reductase subunit A
MVDAARHPKIEILAYSEVERVDGYIGNFRALVTKKPRYVLEDRCNGCGACAKVCPIEVPNPLSWTLPRARRSMSLMGRLCRSSTP